MRHLTLLAVAITGCATGSKDPGTSVGNPGDSSFSPSPVALAVGPVPGAEVVGELNPLSLDLYPCDGSGARSVPVPETIDLPEPAAFELPGGRWCGLGLGVAEPLLIEGVMEDDGRFRLLLDPGTIYLEVAADGGLAVDGQPLVWELAWPGWVDPVDLGVQPGQEVVVGPGHPYEPPLSIAVAEGSALFQDTDVDGSPSDEERSAGPLASGSDRPVGE